MIIVLNNREMRMLINSHKLESLESVMIIFNRLQKQKKLIQILNSN